MIWSLSSYYNFKQSSIGVVGDPVILKRSSSSMKALESIQGDGRSNDYTNVTFAKEH
jgi:hypothetical protein